MSLSELNPIRGNDIPNPTDFGILQKQPTNRNGLLKTHHQFQIRRLPNVSYWCQAANIPSMSLTAINQVTNFNPIKRPGGELVYGDFKIKFMIDENLENWLELRQWFLECSNDADFDDYEPPTKHLDSASVLFILESNNQPKFKVTFGGLFPTFLEGIDFDSTAAKAEFQYATCNFAYTNFEIEPI